MRRVQQQIRFCKSAGGVQLGYAITGNGPPLVKVANFLTHLEFDWRSPVVQPFLLELGRGRTLLRYDPRGCGLSDRDVEDLSLDTWVADLEAVVDAAGIERFPLFAHSQGGAIGIAYAARHPERVSHLILLGGWARSVMKRHLTPAQVDEMRTLVKLAGMGWGRENPSYRQVFTSLLIPDSSPAQAESYNELERMCTSPECAARIFSSVGKLDVMDLAPRVACPTLVLHARGDASVPLEEGRLIAGLIPNARFVQLDGRNHILLPHETAWKQFFDALRAFVGTGAGAAGAFPGLSEREAQVLELIARGHDNAQIAARLELSEKTVRNHITRIFEKMQVETRAQAIVRARDAGFGQA
ncbi:MAG: helix-turn-helix transcriptional regulator [Betaproteobacteria bacterium RIFCSPLOWO2_12_FULL_65_14]|nr:MAG: helix-turn-helix transcriptional regulator [Betaproteobacteria bacterium RIFCSPLOWO2_12_FULL_65_14]